MHADVSVNLFSLIFLSTLFLYALSLCSSLHGGDKATEKVMFLSILVLFEGDKCYG
jgi:hypothetical protein